jgi:hypothetical protein
MDDADTQTLMTAYQTVIVIFSCALGFDFIFSLPFLAYHYSKFIPPEK